MPKYQRRKSLSPKVAVALFSYVTQRKPLLLGIPSPIMQTEIKNEIKKLSLRIFARERSNLLKQEEYQEKFHRRTGKPAGISAASPVATFLDKHFDPKYCARNANFLASTLWHKILTQTYEPKPAESFSVAKATGGVRTIMKFSIPDAAVANVIMKRSRTRNLKRLSAHSYAYHPQKNVFDAILSLSSFMGDEKLFAVQIDFEKYFDNIPTKYMLECLDDKSLISITPHEKYVFKRFLRHRFAAKEDYALSLFKRRMKGTPQGSSLSLFLANIASHELDVALERSAGKFVRFADDVTALCNTYADAERIEQTFISHCSRSGIKINQEKSPGLAILSPKAGEMRTFNFLDYLGYRFEREGLAVPTRIESRIKRKISKLIQIYLIQYPSKFGFNSSRCGLAPDFDWDLLGLITEIRRFLYGGLDEGQIQAFLNKGSQLPKMRGLMGFYALIEQKDTLRRLDGWMADAIERAMRKRKLILAQYGTVGLAPHKTELILGTWLNMNAWKGKPLPEVTLPSFVRGWRAARKHYFTFGLENVEAPTYMAYY